MLRDAFTRHGGVEVDTQGDAYVVERNEETFAISRALLGDAPFEKAAAEGRNLTADDAVELALAAT